MSKYHISKSAIEDLNDIWLYTFNKWSKIQADRYYDLIMQEIVFVANNYTVGRPMEHLRKDYRYIKIKSHLIFYRNTEQDIVEIVRILHQRMDIKKHLD